MKTSFTTMATPGYSIEKTLELAAINRFDGVDIRVSDHKGELTVKSTDAEIAAVKAAFANSGIVPVSLLCYNSRGKTADMASWDEMTDSIVRNMEIAAKLDAPYIRIFGPNVNEGDDTEDIIKRTAESINNALSRDGTNVTVIIQHHKGDFNAEMSVKLADITANPRFGMVFSPEHCILQHEDIISLLPGIKRHARQMYIADLVLTANGSEDTLPGKGEVPHKLCYDGIGGSAFTGFITFKWEKIWNPKLEDAETALPYFMEHIGDILK